GVFNLQSTERVARVGDEVVVSGGRIIEEIDPLLDSELLLLSSFAGGCKGPYWIVGIFWYWNNTPTVIHKECLKSLATMIQSRYHERMIKLRTMFALASCVAALGLLVACTPVTRSPFSTPPLPSTATATPVPETTSEPTAAAIPPATSTVIAPTSTPTAIPSPRAPVSTLTPPPLPPGWAWHAVARYGYGVLYPDTWTVRTRSATYGIVHETTFLPPTDGPAMGVVIDVWKPPEDPAFDLLEWVNLNSDATIRLVLDEPLTYNAIALGRPAVYYFHADDGRTTNMAQVLFATEQGRFRVTMFAPSPLSEEVMPIYRAMLASFTAAGEAEMGVVIP
ncbi:MAG TPA: hypothetical protein PLR07_06050, partial [Promineifilum sp.]|nr:hypothetical protein [Promineifilum sp.]